MKRGLLLGVDSIPGHRLSGVAARAEAAGLDTLWVPEIFGREPFVTAGTLLAGSSDLRVGTAIANVYVRDPMATKAASETLRDIHGDRFSLGLGVSNVVGNGMRDHPWLPPVEKLTSYLDAMERWQLSFKSSGRAPLYIAAHGPKLLEFAARRADGAFMYLTTPAYQAEASRILAGRELLIMQPCMISEDLEEARRVARKAVRVYTELPNYQRAWRAQGFDPADYQNGPSDRLLDALVALGPRTRVLEKLAQRQEAGATQLIIIPLNLDAQREPDWDMLASIGGALS